MYSNKIQIHHVMNWESENNSLFVFKTEWSHKIDIQYVGFVLSLSCTFNKFILVLFRPGKTHKWIKAPEIITVRTPVIFEKYFREKILINISNEKQLPL